MTVRFYRLLAVLVLIVSFSSCRQGRGGDDKRLVYAEEEEWDAGLIPDTLRILQHDFRIINASSDTCRITRIDRTCGCIMTMADRNEILPGGSVTITMRVELDNNPYIDKEVFVYTSLQDEPITLYITAIRGVSDKKIMTQFPFPLGENLRAMSPRIVPPYLEKGKFFNSTANIVNAGTEPIEIEWKMDNAPKWITIEVPSRLQSKELGRVSVVFDLSKDCKEWGYHEYTLFLGEKGKKQYPLTIPAIITPDLSVPKHGKRAVAYIPDTGYSLLDSERQRDVVTKHFDIVNMGGDQLIIADIVPSIPSVKCKWGKRKLKEREKLRFFAEVPVEDLRKDSVLLIGVTTNDKYSPYKEVRIVY